YIYYSMFGLQRVGDLAWAAGDMRCRGFLLGGTAGRTTLNGEGLQHEDGLRRMIAEQEDVFYYITLMNENYQHPAMPEGAEEGIRRGMYLFREGAGGANGDGPRVQLLGSGTILREVI